MNTDPVPEEYYQDIPLIEHYIPFLHIYSTLPPYTSPVYWQMLEAKTTPLELLVHSLRDAHARNDIFIRNRILEIIIRRTQHLTDEWVRSILKYIHLLPAERRDFVSDLCGDFYEYMVRAMFDEKRVFWEKNFFHSLRLARKHVYKTFMMREGRWKDVETKITLRIPRHHLTRLERMLQQEDGEAQLLEAENQLWHEVQRNIEYTDLLYAVLCLPEHLKAIVLLIFWEERTEKDAAALLGITDRTVRNRIREALKILYKDLQDGESTNG